MAQQQNQPQDDGFDTAAEVPAEQRQHYYQGSDGRFYSVSSRIPPGPTIPRDYNFLFAIIIGVAVIFALWGVVVAKGKSDLTSADVATIIASDAGVKAATATANAAKKSADEAGNLAKKATDNVHQLANAATEIDDIKGLKERLAAIEKAQTTLVAKSAVCTTCAAKPAAVAVAAAKPAIKPTTLSEAESARIAALVAENNRLAQAMARRASATATASASAAASAASSTTTAGIWLWHHYQATATAPAPCIISSGDGAGLPPYCKGFSVQARVGNESKAEWLVRVGGGGRPEDTGSFQQAGRRE